MHPEVHHRILEGSVNAKDGGCQQGAEQARGRAQNSHLWDRLYFVNNL